MTTADTTTDTVCGCPEDEAGPTACGDQCCGEHLLGHAQDCRACAADIARCAD